MAYVHTYMRTHTHTHTHTHTPWHSYESQTGPVPRDMSTVAIGILCLITMTPQVDVVMSTLW